MSLGPVVDGTVAVVSGDLVGTVVDRVVSLIGDRTRFIETLRLGQSAATLLDSTIGILLQVGLLSAGTHLVTGALPWILEEPAAFSLYMVGLWSTSGHLKRNLKVLNSTVLVGGYEEREASHKAKRTTTALPEDAKTDPLITSGPEVSGVAPL